MKKFFSIVVPTHNRPEKLTIAINSIYHQYFHNIEVIVVNDGSQLDYSSVFDFFQGKINVISNPVSLGASQSRNIGVQNSKADWVVFLDDDDEFYPGFLQNLYWKINNAEADVGFSWSSVKHQLYGNEGHPAGMNFTFFDAKYETEGETFAQAMRIGCGYGFAVKRSSFVSAGGFDPSYRVGEDTDLIFRLLSAGVKPLINSSVGVVVHAHNENRLTPNFLEHANTGVYDRLISSHKEFIATYPEVLSRFMGWAATVYYMAGNFSRGDEILKEMLKTNFKSMMVWKKYIQILVRRHLIKKDLNKNNVLIGDK